MNKKLIIKDISKILNQIKQTNKKLTSQGHSCLKTLPPPHALAAPAAPGECPHSPEEE